MKISKVKGADSITNAWTMQSNFSEEMRKVAELVQTLMTSENNKNKNNPDFAAALSAVKNELQSTGSASSKSLNNLHEVLGDNNKAKSIVSNALKDVSNSNNNNGDKNFVDKSQNDRNQTEGETVVSADGSINARNLIGVTGNSNAESDQDNGTGSNSKDTLINAYNTKDLNKKADFNPLKAGLNFPERGVASRLEALNVTLTKDVAQAIKKSSAQGDLGELQNTLNNQTKPSKEYF